MKTTVLKKDKCPVCGATLDAHTNVNDDCKPIPGDITLCIKCGSVLQFSKDLSLVVCDQDTFNELPEEVLSQINFIRKSINKINNEN